jgi:hypothetical protein
MKLVALALLGNFLYLQPQSPDSELAAKLRAKDELLLNAVHRGDRKAWANATTPDFMYIEDGDILKREAFLNELEEDGSAPLIIRTYDMHRQGDTAVVVHLDDVPERPGRVTKNSHLLFTEVWQQIGTDWKLRLIDIDRLRVDPPAITLPPAEMDQLVGTYQAGTAIYVIHRGGDRLLGGRKGAKEDELKPEVRDVWFVSGQARYRNIFQRDASGQIMGFVNRDESSDVSWTKVIPGQH